MIELTVGPNVNEEQARSNRENIEVELLTVGVALLPQGVILLDKPLTLKSGNRLVGAGMDQTELRRFGSPGLTIDVSGGGPSAGPAPSDGWVWLSDEGRSEIRRFFNGRPIRPLVRASMEHKYPLDLVTNVRIENMTIGGHIGAVWTAGFSTFRVRVLGTTTVDRSTNFRASYSEFDVFSSYFLEDSVLDANRARQMIGYYGLDLTFRDLRVVGDLNVSGDRLSFTDVRVDGKYEVSDASEGHDNEFGSPL